MLILFHGTDTMRMHYAVRDVIAARGGDATEPSDVFSVDCEDDDALEQLLRPLKYPTFFGGTKVIIARNAASDPVAAILRDFKLSQMDDIVFLAVQDTSVKTHLKTVLKALVSAADRVELFPVLEGPQRIQWAQHYCNEIGADIDPAALGAVLARTGNDTRLLAGELEKLAAYANRTTIDTKMVELLTPARQDYDEWGLSNAIAAHDKRGALAQLWRRLQEGDAPQFLLGSLAAGIRNLMMVRDLASRQQPAASIAKQSGLHPFVVSKTLRGAAASDGNRLRKAHGALADLDRAFKDGRTDATDGLFSIVLSL